MPNRKFDIISTSNRSRVSRYRCMLPHPEQRRVSLAICEPYLNCQDTMVSSFNEMSKIWNSRTGKEQAIAGRSCYLACGWWSWPVCRECISSSKRCIETLLEPSAYLKISIRMENTPKSDGRDSIDNGWLTLRRYLGFEKSMRPRTKSGVPA